MGSDERWVGVDDVAAHLGVGRDSSENLTYPSGQRNNLHNSDQWLVNLRLAKELDFGRGVHGQLTLDVFNALDDDTYKTYNPDLQVGFQVDGIPGARREFGRRWQVGGRLSF